MPDRSRRATRWAAGGLLVAAAAGLSGAAGQPPARVVLTGYGAPAPQEAFRISGGVNGLYPGRSVPFVLSIYDLRPFPITVTSIATSVGAASAACPGTFVQVSKFTGSLYVPGRGQATTTVMATMAHSAPDSCQGALFPFSYTGIGQMP